MICPVCKEDTIVVEYNNIELDYCNGCHGVWFDSTELGLLLQSISLGSQNLLLDDILKSPEAMTQEKKRKRHICGQKMKKTTIGEHPGLLVDICPQEHGFWFDGGEVSHLVRHIAGEHPAGWDSGEQVIGFLEEVFEAPD